MGSLPALLFVASVSIAQAAASPQQTIAPEAIAVAVQHLGAGDFEVRQRATAFLWQAGRVTESALQRASESKDAEVRVRARSILEDFRYGVFADTPENVAALVRRYRREDSTNRELLWPQLLSQASIETLVAITTNEPIGDRRRQVLERLERDGDIEYAVTLAEKWSGEYGSPEDLARLDDFIRRQVPYFLAKQQYVRAESLLEQAATNGPGIRNWAAYLFLRGQLDAEIDQLQRQALQEANGPESLTQIQTKLVHMLRVKGDEDGALAMARQLPANDDSLLRGLLFDQRAWSELATRQRDVLAANPNNLEALGFAAAFNRLAGNKEEFETHIAAIRARTEKLFGGDSLAHCREALFLNGFTDEAVRLLTREDPADAFNVQIMRNQYADAFEAAGIGTTRQSRDAWLAEVLLKPDRSKNWHNNFRIAAQLAQVLATVGERQESVEMFAQLVNSIKTNSEGVQLRQIAESELRAKMVDEAFEHAAQAFDKDRNAVSITLLFVNHSTSAKTWWDIYVALEPNDATQQRLARVRRLFYQQKNHDGVVAQIAETQARIEALESKHASRTKWLHAIGETYAMHQETERARQCFESIAEEHGPAAIRLADMLAKQEEWIAASNWYHSAWQQERQPYALYLYGEMLCRAGAEDAGNESKQLARLIPLAGAARYDALASHLAQRDLDDVAQQECELLRRCSTWSDLQMFHAIASLSQTVAADDPLQAAAYSEQRMLNCLQELWHFTDQGSYVRIPLEVHRDRAQGLLKQHRPFEAVDELRMCQQIWRGDLNIPEAFVPQLDDVGQTAAADELFNRAYELVDETCGMFPNSALHHNNAAWLAAKCKRRLDDALAHVNRAIELVPNEAQYIDTQGEVYFQQGKTDLAIACAKQCVELEPNTAFYQEQLARFQAAQQQPE
ncbi:MAG: hypothetical protein HYV60_24980 [Planctomycetia bacterium]|nr:hypothetical protein [Planctomycetia bacterium]